jgi:hypothetical protein
MVWFQQVKHCGSTWFKQTQSRLRIYPGLELRAQPGLSSLPGSPLCLQLVLVLLDVIVLHSIITATLESTQESHATTRNLVLCQTSAALTLTGQQTAAPV